MTKEKPNRNTEGLKEFAEKKNQETIEKVNKAIDKLKRSKTKAINFKTVAEEAEVSKATLYNNDVLKERISSLRAIEKSNSNGDTVATPKDKVQAKDDKIKKLYEEIKRLKEDKQNLIIQLVDMEQQKDENKRLKEQLDKIKSLNR
jgi:DNA-directed RNA polymerase specialized sigma subunit